MHLSHHLTAMQLDRRFADADIGGNLLLRQPVTTSIITWRSRGHNEACNGTWLTRRAVEY
jgi:hypothetical protein